MPLHKCHRLFFVFLNTHQHETKAAWGDERWGSGELCSAGSTSKKYSKGRLTLSVIKCSCELSLYFLRISDYLAVDIQALNQFTVHLL